MIKAAPHFLLFILISNAKLAFSIRPSDEKITNLPGVNFKFNFEHYSGYLNAGDGNFFHYWFFESQSKPTEDPLILFLNGGPGCSSLVALFTECGPFRIMESGKKIVENPYAFNKIANIIFLESPAGVGFSYSNSEWNLTDDNTAEFHYQALLSFYEKFPEFKQREFYLFGQSYAAIYVTTLAILLRNRENMFPGNLTGMVIGNGVLSWPIIISSRVYYNFHHGLIEEKEWQNLITKCCDNKLCNESRCNFNQYYMDNSTDCYPLVKRAMEASEQGRNPYNINEECYKPSPGYSDDEECGVPFGEITKHLLDREDVRRSMHVDIEKFRRYSFEACSNTVKAAYKNQYNDLTQKMQQILFDVKPMKILLIYGDFDSVTNYIGVQWFIDDLNITNITARIPVSYTGISQSNIGYQQNYEHGLDFVIVRGAGHYVPADRPRESLQLLVNFLRNKRNYSEPANIDVKPAPLISGATVNTGMPLITVLLWIGLQFCISIM